MSKRLYSNESLLIGGVCCIDNDLNFYNVSVRINDLVSNYLIRIAQDESGWQILFQDPEDKRYWELNYPDNKLHGRGVPLLREVPSDVANTKYSINNRI